MILLRHAKKLLMIFLTDWRFPGNFTRCGFVAIVSILINNMYTSFTLVIDTNTTVNSPDKRLPDLRQRIFTPKTNQNDAINV